MITHDFWPRRDDPSWSPEFRPTGPSGDPEEWERVSASDFTFSFFRARTSFIVEKAEFGVDDPDQILLDYCIMLNLACSELQARRGAVVENATGSLKMYFIREAHNLHVASDRVQAVPLVPVSEFHAAVSGFLDSALSAVAAEHPEVQNGEFWRRAAKARCRGRH